MALGAAAVLGYCVLRWGLGGLGPNAADVLVQARQQADPGWLPHDAAASADVPYRLLFEMLAGPWLVLLGVDEGARLVRLILCIGAASGLVHLFRQVRVHPLLWIPVVAVLGASPGIGAGEWMLLAAEAKCAAWLAGLGGLALGLSGRDRLAAVLLGLSVGFHALVGGGIGVGVGTALVLGGRWQRLRALPWALLPAVPGLVAVEEYLVGGTTGLTAAEAAAAAETYVRGRMAHHVMPPRFAEGWLARAGLSGLGLTMLWRRGGPGRELAAVAVGSLPLALLGALFWWFDAAAWLRFQWFRVPDLLLPFAGALGIAAVVSEWRGMRYLGGALGLALFLVPTLMEARPMSIVSHVEAGMSPRADPAHACVKAAVPPHERVLADPTDAMLTLRSGRSRVVSFKQSPHAERDVFDWLQRLHAASGGMPLLGGLEGRTALQAGWRRMSWAERTAVARRHRAAFILVRSDRIPEGVPVRCEGAGRALVSIQEG